MEALKTVIWIVNIFSALAIIVLVLMQHGKGADAGASFGGSGSAQGVFGSAGNANFLSRMTGICAMIFFATCLGLGYVNTNNANGTSIDFSHIQQSEPTKEVEPVNVASESAVVNQPTAASDTQVASSTIASVVSEPAAQVASETKPVKKGKGKKSK